MPANRRKTTGTSANFLTGPIRTVYEGTTNIKFSDSSMLVDASLGAATLVLPTAIEHAGTMFWIKKTDSSANSVTLQAILGQEIDGLSSRDLIRQHEQMIVISDGTDWLLYVKQERTVDQQWSFPGTLSTDQNTNLYTLTARKLTAFVAFDLQVNVAPAGSSIIVDWEINGIVDVDLQVMIPAGETYAQILATRVLQIGDTLHPLVVQVGAQTPGQTMLIRARGT